MKTIEYKHIRFAPGFFTYISPRKFGPAMMAMLEEQGKDGWELRGTFHEGFNMHVHFIFAREAVLQSQQHEKRAAEQDRCRQGRDSASVDNQTPLARPA